MRYYLILIFILAGSISYSQQSVSEVLSNFDKQLEYNNPVLRYGKWSFTSYENLQVSGDPEAITGPGYKKKELRKTLMQTGAFFSEKLSLITQDSTGNEREKVIAANMPGFNEPVYPIYSINFQNNQLYSKKYIIWDIELDNPLRSEYRNKYDYALKNDSVINSRPVIKLDFTRKNNDGNIKLYGSFYLDKETQAIAGAILKSDGVLSIEARHSYDYDTNDDLWLPVARSLFVVQNKTTKEFELFGGRLEVGSENEIQSSENLYLSIQVKNADFKNDPNLELGPRSLITDLRYATTIQDSTYWKPYRNKDAVTTNELAQQFNLDSIIDESRITRKLEIVDKFKIGYYPIGPFDIDLKYLIKFNDYEAFRVGIGGTTNEKLFEDWRISGYLAYGTKDRTFKYKANLGYRISKNQNTWLNIYKSDDIAELGAAAFSTDARVYSLFEPRLINIPTFYLYKEYGMSLQQRVDPSILSEITLSRKRINQTTQYRFMPGDTALDSYVLSEASLAARWSPNSTYLRSPKGYQEIDNGYPVLTAQLTKGFADVVESDFNYLKLSAKLNYNWRHNSTSNTDLFIEGHYARGDVPLTHLFHAYPNAPNKEEVLQRFSVAGRRSFETMFFNEFFSDRLLVAQVKHKFSPLDIASFFKPQLVLISRAALGDIKRPEEHLNIDFQSLDRGYLESGLEINQILFGFGLSFTYRYGPYHLPTFEDNLALKFTFYLEI